MATNEYLVSELITAVRDTGMLPEAEEDESNTRLLGFLNREQRLYLTRLLLSVRESYRVASVDVALTSGQTTVRIPSRAVGAKLKRLEWVVSGEPSRPLNPMNSGDVFEAGQAGGAGEFYLQDNSIVFPSAPGSGTLRVVYYRRLNKLVAAEDTGMIIAFNSTGVTLDDDVDFIFPEDFTVYETYDLIQARPHFDILAADLVPQSVDSVSKTIIFTETLPEDLVEGDYLALSGQTPFCMAPVELHDVLVHRALEQYLKSAGDAAAAKAVGETLTQMREDALAILCPRVEDPATPLINYNAPGWNRRWRR